MIPENVLNAIHEQMQHPILELSKYCVPGETVWMHFTSASVEINIKK